MEWDTSKFDAALGMMLSQTKREVSVVLMEQARGVVRRVVALTPPKSKGAGSVTIRADLKRIMRPASIKQAVFETPKDVHERYRSKSTGRVNPRARKQLIPIVREEFVEFRRQLLTHVGWLKSGWRASAERLGAPMPSWARLPAPGEVLIDFESDQLTIEIANQVRYAGAVKGLVRILQTALDGQAGAMERRALSALEKAAQKCGFST